MTAHTPSSAAERSEQPRQSRRHFVATGFLALAYRSLHSGPWLSGIEPTRRPRKAFARDPRLSARPGRPFREPTTGVSWIGAELDRKAILYVPESYRSDQPAPLVVALHGAGGSAGSWARLYDSCERHGVVLLAPDARGRTWDRVGGVFGPDVAFIDAALRHTFERCAIDESHIALAGFSDGASYALSLGPSNGDLFTHLVAWSPGFSDPQEPIVGSPPVFISHGTADRVLSVAGTRHALVPMFEMDGYAVEYLEFDGVHELPSDVVGAAMDWFLND